MQIPIEQQVIGLLFGLTLLLVTIQLIRKHRLREEYSIVWLGASLAIFILIVVDPLVGMLARLFAVTYAPTIILVFGILFCVVLLLSQTVTISAQANRIRDLAQSIGILEWRLRHVERAMATQAQLVVPSLLTTQAAADELAAATANGATPMAALPTTAPIAAQSTRKSSGGPNKVLVLGLDGATFDLIKPWAAAGYLPTLNRLMAEGAQGSLRSTTPPMTGPAWTSFATGVNPGKHRLYDWIAR